MIPAGERELLASYGPTYMDALDRTLFGSPRPSMEPTAIPSLAGVTSAAARDRLFEAALLNNGVAPHLFDWVPVELTHGPLRATVYVSPDWVGFGSAAALFRVPLKARAAWRVAQRYGCVLPTQRIVEAIHAQGDVHVPFTAERTWAQQHHVDMDTFAVWQEFNDDIERERAGRVGLVTDAAKDVVVGAMQRRAWPTKVCIFGAWESAAPTAAPVQSLSTVHVVGYGDYSQLFRLVRDVVTVQGVGNLPIAQVFGSRELYPLLLDTDPHSLERATAPLTAFGYA